MITKLLLATTAIGALSAPVANYQHTTQVGNVNITYQYETNEVNSLDDLVVGNIYTFTFDTSVSAFARIGIDRIVFDDDISQYNLQNISTEYDTTIRINYNYQGVSYPVFIITNLRDDTNCFTTTQPINFIYGNPSYNSNLDVILPMISKCDNIPIISVEEHYVTGLFGNLADFLRYHIYGGIPHVTDIQFEIANQTITMLDWLVVTTSIALAVLSLVLLFYFFRWVFKLFSGLILLR